MYALSTSQKNRLHNKASRLTGHLAAVFLTQGSLFVYVQKNNIFDLTHCNLVNLSDDLGTQEGQKFKHLSN